MNRSSRLQADPAKARAWQERAARAYAERQRAKANEAAPRARERKPPPTPRARPETVDASPAPARRRPRSTRRNDGPWRAECVDAYGEWCRNCLGTKNVQMDHVWPRSQGGPSVVENGLPLCGPFGNGCHDQKTAGALQFQRSWFTERQVAWLAEVGWVAWDDDGQPRGRGWKHFAPALGRDAERKGGEDG